MLELVNYTIRPIIRVVESSELENYSKDLNIKKLNLRLFKMLKTCTYLITNICYIIPITYATINRTTFTKSHL